MFQHILLPIDSSVLSKKSANAGLRLAKAIGARATLCFVIQGRNSFASANPTAAFEFQRTGREVAKQAISKVAAIAKRLDVDHEEVISIADAPYLGITSIAKGRRCDLI